MHTDGRKAYMIIPGMLSLVLGVGGLLRGAVIWGLVSLGVAALLLGTGITHGIRALRGRHAQES